MRIDPPCAGCGNTEHWAIKSRGKDNYCGDCVRVSVKYRPPSVQLQQEKYAQDILQPGDERFAKVYGHNKAKNIEKAAEDNAKAMDARNKSVKDIEIDL